MKNLTQHEQDLLLGWEEVYKKGQLSFWVMLALRDSPKHMGAIKEFMQQASEQTITPDDKSIYRTLRKLYDGGVVDFCRVSGNGGPDRKAYELSESGQKILSAFVRRNIRLLFNEDIQNLLN